MKIPHLLPFVLVAFAVQPLLAADAPAASSAGPAPAVTPADFAASGLGFGPTIAADAVVTKIEGGYQFTEGNATDAKTGDVYFVDQPANRIHKWSAADNKVSLFLEPSGRANGMYFDAKGNLIACADEKNEVWSITPDGKHTVLVSSAGFEGKPLDGPNDVWVRPDGGLYLTDPHYRRNWWDPSVTRPAQSIRSVYYLAPGAKELKRVAADFQMPNGIIGTPDGKTLYVADINARQTFAFDIQPDGSLANRRHIANYGSDGMTIDNQGNLYFTTGLGGGARGGRGRGGAPGAPAAGGAPAPAAGAAATPPAPTAATATAPGAAPAAAPNAPRAGGPPGGGRGGPGSAGVAIVDPKNGKLIGFITVPEQPANLAFGGKDHDTLIMSARTGLYSIKTKVKGANPAK
jgi:gluconolactonase